MTRPMPSPKGTNHAKLFLHSAFPTSMDIFSLAWDQGLEYFAPAPARRAPPRMAQDVNLRALGEFLCSLEGQGGAQDAGGWQDIYSANRSTIGGIPEPYSPWPAARPGRRAISHRRGWREPVVDRLEIWPHGDGRRRRAGRDIFRAEPLDVTDGGRVGRGGESGWI